MRTTPALAPREITFRTLDVGEVRLHVACAGPDDAKKTVVLLHGFPEFWASWRHQIQALAAAGFRVFAPDLRGYGKSDKPEGVEAYAIRHLVGDVAGLLRAVGAEKVFLAAHDWGGEIAWRVTMAHPDRVERLCVLNIPHPVMLMRGLRTARQLRKSWYMFFFQFPALAERLLAKGDFAFLRRIFEADGFTRQEIEPYVEAFRNPGALTSALNYYRAAGRALLSRDRPTLARIECPVLVLWGKKDRALGYEMAVPPERWVPNARVQFFENASHWLAHDEPERVSEHLVEFFRPS